MHSWCFELSRFMPLFGSHGVIHLPSKGTAITLFGSGEEQQTLADPESAAKAVLATEDIHSQKAWLSPFHFFVTR